MDEAQLAGTMPIDIRLYSASCYQSTSNMQRESPAKIGGGDIRSAVLVLHEGEFLKGPVDDGFGIELQPVFQNRGIDATEVMIGYEVTL